MKSATLQPAELDHFRSRYAPPERPKIDPLPHEKTRIVSHLRILGPAPADDVSTGTPPRGRGQPTGRYLWVIDDYGIPYIIESPLGELGNRPPKHTNLTGGGRAYVGGELWFSNSQSIYVSGGSGRYPPRNETQLVDAVAVFAAYNYAVTSLGWDYETGRAERVLKP